MDIQAIEISFTHHPLLEAFVIGKQPPITEITRLVVNAKVDGVVGFGQTTLANVWAGAELEDMQAYAIVLQQQVRTIMQAETPLGVYEAVTPQLLADSSLSNMVAKLICYAPFDLALWDAWGKKHGKHPCQMLASDARYADLFLLRPRRQVYVEYTLGGVSPLLGKSGLIATKLQNGYRIVKVKCVGNPEADFNRVMAVYAATNCQIWLDFNGAGNPEGVSQLCDALRACLRQGELLAVEQPFSTSEIFDPDVHGMSQYVPFFLDEKAVLPADIGQAKTRGYGGIVVKADKGGLSHLAEMVRVAKEHGMLVSAQDLTSHPWASLGIAAYLTDLHMGIVEMNQGQFLMTPEPVDIRNGAVDTSSLTGPGFYP